VRELSYLHAIVVRVRVAVKVCCEALERSHVARDSHLFKNKRYLSQVQWPKRNEASYQSPPSHWRHKLELVARFKWPL